MSLTAHEINRKLLHLIALLLPAGIFYIPIYLNTSQMLPVVICGLIFTVIIIIDIIRRNSLKYNSIFILLFGRMMRAREHKKFTGATYIIGSAFICSLLFYKEPHIAFISLSMFILGDAVAAIVGLSIGRIKLLGKSLEGSAACFLVCMFLMLLVFPFLPMLLDAWCGKISFLYAVIISFSITILELFPVKITKKLEIDDNIVVPVIAGIIIYFLFAGI
ncbi:MAG: hypothetical protein K9L30_10540 [Desulfobacterales bacterium]|nr:hypothetical protein [Desulfobacterales bacterium]